jgi:hypothetical protein
MNGAAYDMHGVLRVEVTGLSAYALRAFNCAYGFFRTAKAGPEPDLSVSIGPFTPDLSGCANVDHKFHVRKDYVYYRETDKGLKWEAEIRGLDGGPVRVRYHAALSNRFRFPWILFPEMVLNLYILQPLLDYLFWRKGHFLLHSAGVEKDGRACLIAGRGGAHKTTFVMQLLKRGWNLLGDDMVLLQGGTVKSFPTIVEQLEYLHRHCETEAMGLRRKVGLFAFLAGDKARGLPVTAAAKLAAVNLIHVRNCPAPAMRPDWDPEMLAASLAGNHLMERNTYVGFKFSTAAFLDAYAYVFPEAGLERYAPDLSAAVRTAVAGIPFQVLEVPRKWDSRCLDMLQL